MPGDIRPDKVAARMRMALMPKSEPIADFVHRQNVERYRRLTPLDTQQRQVILDLLAREEAVERQVLCASQGHARARSLH
jgi:hypothetical protein